MSTVAAVQRRPAAAAGARHDPRRLVTFVAALSLLAGLFSTWRTVESRSTPGSVIVVIGFAIALLAVIAAVTVPERHLGRFDFGLLGVAVVLFVVEHAQVFSLGHPGGTDEARLGHGALRLLLAGQDPYAARIPERAGTRLMNGNVVTHYAYPPLTMELGWLLHHVAPRLGQPWVVAVLAVAATVVVVFLALPDGWRALAIPVTLGFGLLSNYALNGFPALIALPFLCMAATRWTEIGAGGRLGLRGAARAGALGLAISAQQLAWFVSLLMVVAVWVVRCGELPRPRAALVAGRFAGIALGVFAVVNLPFLLWNARSWFNGILTVFTQQAKPFGAGLILVIVQVVGHSSDLRYLTYATAALAAGVVVVTAAGLRRIGAAVPVLAALPFLFGIRSDVEYFVAFSPLWLVWAATTDRELVAGSRPIRLPAAIGPVLTSLPRRCVAVSLGVVPSAVLAALAVTGPAPIAVHLPTAVRAGTRLTHLHVTVANRSTGTLEATFSVGPRGHGRPWRPLSGRVVLAPGQLAPVTLVSGRPPDRVSAAWQVTVFSSRPPAFTSVPLRVRAGPERRREVRAAP